MTNNTLEFTPALKNYGAIIKELKTDTVGDSHSLVITWLIAGDNQELFTATSRFTIWNREGSEVPSMKLIASALLKTRFDSPEELAEVVASPLPSVLSAMYQVELGQAKFNRFGKTRYQVVKAFVRKRGRKPLAVSDQQRQLLIEHWKQNPLSVTI